MELAVKFIYGGGNRQAIIDSCSAIEGVVNAIDPLTTPWKFASEVHEGIPEVDDFKECLIGP